VFGECNTEDQRFLVRFFFCRQKNTMQRICIKQCFLFTVGSVCRVKRVHLSDKRFADDAEVETEVRKSKDLFAAGFDALVK
jgi:hypothetical protein